MATAMVVMWSGGPFLPDGSEMPGGWYVVIVDDWQLVGMRGPYDTEREARHEADGYAADAV